MNSLAEIEAVVDSLPMAQQEELLRHLADRLHVPVASRHVLPVIPGSGRPITQQELDDARDAE